MDILKLFPHKGFCLHYPTKRVAVVPKYRVQVVPLFKVLTQHILLKIRDAESETCIIQVLTWMVRMTADVENNIVAVERIKEYTKGQIINDVRNI